MYHSNLNRNPRPKAPPPQAVEGTLSSIPHPHNWHNHFNENQYVLLELATTLPKANENGEGFMEGGGGVHD